MVKKLIKETKTLLLRLIPREKKSISLREQISTLDDLGIKPTEKVIVELKGS